MADLRQTEGTKSPDCGSQARAGANVGNTIEEEKVLEKSMCVALIRNRQHSQTEGGAGAPIDLGYGNEVHFLSPLKLKLATAAEFNEYIDYIR